jgi:hypothetical protein
MQANWEYVKKTTLWHYEDLIKKLNAVASYNSIWRAYNMDLSGAIDFARRLFTKGEIDTGRYPAAVLQTVDTLRTAGVRNWEDLLDNVTTREDCLRFIANYNLQFEESIDLLNYLLRWGLPFPIPSRELLDMDNPEEAACYGSLKANKLMSSFDVLERGCSQQDRDALVGLTGINEDFVTALVHRADISRLPYSRGKTVRYLCGAGYDSLSRIATADLSQFHRDMDAFMMQTQGKPWQNFKAVIPLEDLVRWAQALPVLFKE